MCDIYILYSCGIYFFDINLALSLIIYSFNFTIPNFLIKSIKIFLIKSMKKIKIGFKFDKSVKLDINFLSSY